MRDETERLRQLIQQARAEDLYSVGKVDLSDLYRDRDHHSFYQHAPESAIVAILKQCRKLGATDSYGRNALHHSLSYRRAFVTRWLLGHPSLFSTQDKDGWTPLHLAIRVGDLPAAEYLLRQSLQPHRPLSDGRTPLQLALQYGHPTLVRSLLEAGGKTEDEDSKNWNAWYYAVTSPSSERCLPVLWEKSIPPPDNALVQLAQRHLSPDWYLRVRAATGVAVE